MKEKKYSENKAIDYFEKEIENLWEGDDAPLILNSISAEEYERIAKAKII